MWGKAENMVKVSVLVPIYNVEKYLSQCLDSLMRQTLSEIEMICVDDGSRDQSGLILDEYAERDKRIKALHKQNTGYGNTMNVALDHASGDYIAILESDDFAEPDMLKTLYTKAVEKNVDVVKANLYGYRDGKDTYEDRVSGYPLDEVTYITECPKILSMADSIWSCIYKRNFLVNHCIRFHETPGAAFQDISFAEQVWLSAEAVCFLDKPVLHYRRDNENSSMYNNRKIFSVFEEYGWVEELYKSRFRSEERMKKLAPFYYATKYQDYLNHYRRVGSQFQYALLLRLVEELKSDQKAGLLIEKAFQAEVWETLKEIEKDTYAFFEQTAKGFEDIRMRGVTFRNEAAYAEGFVNAIRAKRKVVLYGAGQVGQRLAKMLLDRGVHIDCFIVTEIVNAPKNILGIPVKELGELYGKEKGCCAIIAVTERRQIELYQNLREAGFTDIYHVDTIVRTLLQNKEEKG